MNEKAEFKEEVIEVVEKEDTEKKDPKKQPKKKSSSESKEKEPSKLEELANHILRTSGSKHLRDLAREALEEIK